MATSRSVAAVNNLAPTFGPVTNGRKFTGTYVTGSIVVDQDLVNNAEVGEAILPGKTRTARESAYARFTRGGFRPGGALRGVLLSFLTATPFSPDPVAADNTNVVPADGSANDPDGVAVRLSDESPTIYNTNQIDADGGVLDPDGPAASSKLSAVAEIIGDETEEQSSEGNTNPTHAQFSYYNRISHPTYHRGAASSGTSIGDDPPLDNPGGHDMGEPEASGGTTRGFTSEANYGINRNSNQPHEVSSPKPVSDKYLGRLFGTLGAGYRGYTGSYRLR